MIAKDLVSPVLIVVAVIIASIISRHSPYWFLPLILAVVPIIGFYSARFFLLDTGIIISIISYLFVNRGFALNISNILVVIGPFFLFIGVWFFARNRMMISRMKDVIEKDPNERLKSFRRDSLIVIFNNLVFGAFLAILGSMLGMYSSLEITLGSNVQIILMVVFSAIVFFLMYLNIDLLSSKNVEG